MIYIFNYVMHNQAVQSLCGMQKHLVSSVELQQWFLFACNCSLF
uniref:Uncharacterized protein n=1 Tax=Manihot esculenta TaxID=3983 RepID=A0A2C9WJM6_MANES